MKKRHWIIGTILAGSVLSLGAVNIANACAGGHGGHHRGNGMMHVMKSLDLSKEQRASIQTIMQAQRDKMQSNRTQMQEIRKSLHEQVMSSQFDANKVRALADAKAKIMADMTVQRVESMNRIRHVLTPEQAAKLDSMRKEHGFRHDKS